MPFAVAPLRSAAFPGGLGALLGVHPHTYPSFSSILWSGKFTEFYCQNNGNNVNSGSDTNASAKYTSTNGNWSTTTIQYIPTDGSTPQGTVNPGDFVSIYLDGATTAVFIARVESVAPGVNGAITLKSGYSAGTPPSTGATGRSIKCGGAWKGPSGANGFPLTIPIDALVGAEGYQPRMNFKNDQIYSLTAAITLGGGATQETINYQGFAVTPGDGGRAIFDWGGLAVNGIFFPNANSTFSCALYVDLELRNTGSVNTLAIGGGIFWRCCFHDSGQQLFQVSSAAFFYECEFYRGNINAISNSGFITNAGATFVRCYFHDPGANPPAPFLAITCFCVDCIFDTNSYCAFRIFDANQNSSYGNFFNCTFYKCGSVISMEGNTTFGRRLFGANNLVVNCGAFIAYAGNLQTPQTGWQMTFFNTAFFGLQGPVFPVINNLRGAFQSIGEIHLSSNPLVSPDTGDFRPANSGIIGAGRGNFLQTGLGKTGTFSYPDVGAVQAGAGTVANLDASVLTLLDGYVSQAYSSRQDFNQSFAIGLVSGSLPPGLFMTQPAPTAWQVAGTPTTVGSYSAVFAASNPLTGSSAVFTINITVFASANVGTSGIGGI